MISSIIQFPKFMKFSYKLALTISLSALLTFIVLDVSLVVLYQFILSEQTVSQGYNSNQFNEFSSQQIISTAKNNLVTEIAIYEQMIAQIYQIYQTFMANPQLYVSKQQKGINPKLTNTFQSPKYDESSVYFYTDSSTFYNEPYIDRSLSVSMSQNNPYYAKRINVIYQSLSNSEDIMVRTVPATSDFTIPSVQSVSARFQGLNTGKISLSSWYYDVFSKSNQTVKLVAVRAQIPNLVGYRMLFQVQIQSQFINQSLNTIYSYTSTGLALLYLFNTTSIATSDFTVLGSSDTMQKFTNLINMSKIIEPGSYNISNPDLSTHDFLVTTVAINNQKQFSNLSISENSNPINTLRLVMVLNKTETNLADAAYERFQQSQHATLLEFLFVWSICMVLIMVSIGYGIADYLFSYFGYIRKKCKQYIQNPETAESSYFQMKQKASQQNHNRVLLQNMISIIQKIQAKKKMHQKYVDPNKKKRRLNSQLQMSRPINKLSKNQDKNHGKELKKQKSTFDQYPLNLLSAQFQQENNLKDWERFQAIGKQIEQKINAAAAAAKAAAAAEKQKQA